MMNRRRALQGISASVLGMVGSSSSALAKLLRSGLLSGQSGPAGTPASGGGNDAIDARLRESLAGFATRANSEEGVPVFLACMNLVKGPDPQKSLAVKLTPLNTTIAGQFRENAAAWLRIRPKAPASDVAQLIEVLAERDFARPEMEQKS